LAEYCQNASPQATPDEIINAMLKDYPTIDGRSFGRYRGAWRSKPSSFPALAPFLDKKGELRLKGIGEKLKQPRYLGGWDLSRVLKLAPAAEKERLARLSEAIHIPLNLPELKAVIEDLQGSTPLKQTNMLWITHALADIVPMAFSLIEAGAKPQNIQVVTSPYGSNRSVCECLNDLGFSVQRPQLAVDDYRQKVKAALDQIIELHKKNGEPIVIIDDGGLASDILHNDPKYAPFLHRIRLVEQTTGGILLAEQHALKTPIINVARSRSKHAEGPAIGEVVAAKIVQALNRHGDGLRGKSITLIGYGIIGPAIAREMSALGAKVTVVERSSQAASKAKKLYKTVQDDPSSPSAVSERLKAIATADLVVGATGRQSITLDDLKAMKNGAAFASASSKQNEADIAGLTKSARQRTLIPQDNPLLTLPTVLYQLGAKSLTIIGDGWPVNFDGGVQSVPPEKIQLTDAAMLSAVLQAAKAVGKQGLIDLDAKTDQKLLERHTQFAKSSRTPSALVYDPDHWQQDLLALAKTIAS